MKIPDEIAALDARARRLETPCGEGTMVWRSWGEGPAVVLLHGGYGGWPHWVKNIDYLAKKRRVLVPDIPGHGDSAPPPRPYDGNSIGTIIADGAKALVPEPEKIQVVGFSFGGLISGFVARALGDRCRSWTGVSPAGLGARRGTNLKELIEWKGLEPEKILEIHRANLANIMFSDNGVVDDTALYIQATYVPLGRVRVLQIVRTPALLEILPDLKMPMDSMWGEFDRAAWPYLPERQELIRKTCPDADTPLVPGAGHWSAYEAADIFNPMLERLLDKRL